MINFFKKRATLIILLLIFLVGIFLRFYQLSEFPVGFHIDEASLGYNGYSLLLTGKDDNNNRLPLYIDMFGDNRPSGYHYLTILPIKFFGLTEFATRFPGALFGSLTVFAIFFLTFVIFNDKKVSLLSSLALAISPWHIVLSRASAETIVALFFIMVGFGLILYGVQKEKLRHIIFGSFFLSLSFFFYHTPRVFVPLLFFLILIVLFKSWIRSKMSLKIGILSSFLFISLISMLLVFMVAAGTGRFSQVNIFGFPETRLVIEEQIREDGVSDVLLFATRATHNKIVNYSLTFASNYLEYFSGNFLFIEGGLPIWYRVPNMGLIYLLELPFILVGAVILAVHKKIIFKIPLIWLIAGPFVAALTVDDVPNIQRAIVMFPMIEIIAAYGLVYVVSIMKFSLRKFIILAISLVFVFNFYYFLHQYFIHSKVHRAWYRNNGFKEMIETVKKSYDSYDKIIVTKSTGGIYPLILFYMKMDPQIYQEAGSPKDREYAGFAKFFFVPQACPSIDKDARFPVGRSIYVDNGTCRETKRIINKKKIFINKEDGTSAFRIVYD